GLQRRRGRLLCHRLRNEREVGESGQAALERRRHFARDVENRRGDASLGLRVDGFDVEGKERGQDHRRENRGQEQLSHLVSPFFRFSILTSSRVTAVRMEFSPVWSESILPHIAVSFSLASCRYLALSCSKY